MFPCISGALLWIHRAPEPLPLLLLDAIVLNYFYVFRKGLIQFKEGVPIGIYVPIIKCDQKTCPNCKLFQLELCQLRSLPELLFLLLFIYRFSKVI